MQKKKKQPNFMMKKTIGGAHFAASLQRVKTRPSNECPVYNMKQTDGESPVITELWGIRSTPSLPSLPGSPWPWLLTPDRILSMGQIELFVIKICTYA